MCVYRKKVSLTLNNRNRTMKNRTSWLKEVACCRMSEWGWSWPPRKADLPRVFETGSFPILWGRWGVFGNMRRAYIVTFTRHVASTLNQDVHDKFLFMVLFKTSQWEWPNLFIPLSARQWLGNSKWGSIILSTMERLPQTLHTYIQPNSPRGRHKQGQHISATFLQHCQDVGPISQRCWTAVIENDSSVPTHFRKCAFWLGLPLRKLLRYKRQQ